MTPRNTSKSFTWVVTTHSEDQTLALGEQLGRALSAGDVVLLHGELGAGKTRFVQGIALGLQTTQTPRSPTFVLVNRLQGRLTLHHCDLYRLNGPDEVEDLGLRELADAGDVVVVEWAERGRVALPADALDVTIVPGIRETDREFSFSAEGAKACRLLAALREAGIYAAEGSEHS